MNETTRLAIFLDLSNSSSVVRITCLFSGLILCITLFATGCAEESHFARASISGNRAVADEFAGEWYDHQDNLMLSVHGSSSPWLSMRMQPGVRIEEAHTVQLGIQFRLVSASESHEMVLGMHKEDMAIVVCPGMDPKANWFCGSCYPRLVRSTWLTRTFSKAKRTVSGLVD